jgi:8-hydroxy-5-deazaflavin:NADPH oxidoreductase
MRQPLVWLSAGMRIAVIGTGNIGGTLGSRWCAAGQDVVYGSRTASGEGPEASGRPEGPGGAPQRPVAESIDGADVVVLAVPGGAVADVIGGHGAAHAGKVIIDATNSMGGAEYNSRAAISAAAPDASYVRAFNTLGWENFADPLPGTQLFCAADPAARQVAEELIAAIGLEPVFVGDGGATKTVDGSLPLWFTLVQQYGGNRKLAFRVIR